MHWRVFIRLIGGAVVAWPFLARAQQPERMRRIGWLTAADENEPGLQADQAALREALAKLGWIEAAKAIGLTIPEAFLLLRADRVIK